VGAVIRKHWYKPRFWVWWWRNRASDRLRLGLALGLCLAGGVAGYLAAGRLAPARASTVTSVATRTVQVTVNGAAVARTVTVRAPGPVTRKTVRVVKTVDGPARTSYLTQTVVVPRAVTVPVTRQVPTTVTVTETRTVPTVETTTAVVTQQVTQTVVQVLR
jgi:hypothetical protein